MNILLIIISILATIFLPIISVFINIANFILIKKERKLYALLTAFSLGLIAYTWKPAIAYDLYRWQQEIRMFSYSDFSAVIQRVITDLEPLNYIIKYIISKTGNFNLVQFFISFIGYYEILWIIADYSKSKKINILPFTIGTIFILLSLKYIDFISGLWFNFAIINFALGIYLDYIKKTKRIHWIFYIISVLTHISTIYLFILLIINKTVRIKKNKKAIIAAFLLSMLLGPILFFLDKHVNIYIIHYISKLYNVYFINGEQFDYLHSGVNFIYAIIRLIITLIIVYFERKNIKNYNPKLVTFILLTSASTSGILFHAKVYIRFIFFIQLSAIPIFFSFLSKKNTYFKTLIISSIVLFSVLLIRMQYNQMKSSKLLKCINYNLNKNVFNLKNGWSE